RRRGMVGNARRLPVLGLCSKEGGMQRDHLKLPSPRVTLRHACPLVLQAVIVPVELFYVLLVTAGFRGALVAALVWSYVAVARRLRRGERVSTMLLLGTVLLTAR